MAKGTETAIRDGGPAFLSVETHPNYDFPMHFHGMTLRDWFASHAPAPTVDQIESGYRYDKMRNPHNDAHKPKLRSRAEIIADLAFEHADAMLAAREGR